MVATRELPAGGQQKVEMAAPLGRVFAATKALSLGRIQYAFDPPPKP